MISFESHRSSFRLLRRAEQRNPACAECYLIGNRETIWLFAMEECAGETLCQHCFVHRVPALRDAGLEGGVDDGKLRRLG